MKRFIGFVIAVLLLSSCGNPRSDYYVFSFGDYSLTPGYDDVDFVRLVFDVDTGAKMEAGQEINDLEVYLFSDYVCSIDIYNPSSRTVDIGKARIKRLDYFVGNISVDTLMIDGIELDSSVKKNCEIFKGEYIERNGYACVISKKVHGTENVIILSGDLLNIDQDELHRIQIYVE